MAQGQAVEQAQVEQAARVALAVQAAQVDLVGQADPADLAERAQALVDLPLVLVFNLPTPQNKINS